MPEKIIKKLWQNNKIAIKNNKNKKTFEAMKKMYQYAPPYIFDNENGESILEINKWQDLKKIDFEYFYSDGARLLSENAVILGPKEFL